MKLEIRNGDEVLLVIRDGKDVFVRTADVNAGGLSADVCLEPGQLDRLIKFLQEARKQNTKGK